MIGFRIAAFCSWFLLMALPPVRATPLDWAQINPNLKNADSITSSTECLDCHEDSIKAFIKTTHARVYKTKFNIKGPAMCEQCHGPLSEHLKVDPADYDKKRATVVSFGSLSAQTKNRICLQCHENSNRMQWRGSTHEMSDVACVNCHYVMKRRSRQSMLTYGDSRKVCFQCHRDKKATVLRSAHMPLREGKMSCASCHNPHGGPGPSLLKSATVNETCYVCHQEKRGPMIWEHPPVRENCSTCHDAHGSMHASMLKRKPPYLCQQCHQQVFHLGTLYDGRDLPGGSASEKLLGKSCLNCHSHIHGSNHPSGARLTR